VLSKAVNPRNTMESRAGCINCAAVPFGLDHEIRTIDTAEEFTDRVSHGFRGMTKNKGSYTAEVLHAGK